KQIRRSHPDIACHQIGSVIVVKTLFMRILVECGGYQSYADRKLIEVPVVAREELRIVTGDSPPVSDAAGYSDTFAPLIPATSGRRRLVRTFDQLAKPVFLHRRPNRGQLRFFRFKSLDIHVIEESRQVLCELVPDDLLNQSGLSLCSL